MTGSWETHNVSASTRIDGNFYSTKWDWREDMPDSETHTFTKSRKVAEDNFAAVGQFFGRCVYVTRRGHYYAVTRTESSQGRYLRVACAIPFSDRSAYYMIKQYGASVSSVLENGANDMINGPISHQYELYNFLWHWAGGCGAPTGGGRCIAKKVAEIESFSCDTTIAPPDAMYYAVCPEFPSTTQPLTVRASWGDAVIGSASWPQLSLPSNYTRVVKPAQAEVGFELWFVNDSGHGETQIKKGFVRGSNDPLDLDFSPWWFRASPDENGSMPWMGSVYSCLGANVANFSDDMSGNTKNLGGPENMRGSERTCYTGVIE